jgi:drug/metabolite transporter (DMT)-like permease
MSNVEPTDITQRERIRQWMMSYGLILIGVIMWSFSEILQKLLQDTVPPMSKSFFRFFIGIIPLGLILVGKKDHKIKEFWKRNRTELLIAGVFGFGIGNFIYFMGIEQTQANIGSVIYGTYPIFISIYSIFLVKENRDLKRRFIGYIIGMLGIAILLTNGRFNAFLEQENLYGNLLVLLGAIIWSLFSVIGKRITLKDRKTITNIDLKYNYVTMALAAITNLSFLIFMPEELNTFFNYPLQSWFYLSLLGVFSTAIGTWLFFVGLEHIEVSKGISFAMFKPIFVVFFAYFILDEVPSVIIFISLPIILLAVFIVTRPSKSVK